MNSTKIIGIWILGILGLALLFILSSTDLIIKDKSNEVYNMSIIIDDDSDENYANFKRGADKAAIDYNIDINFITLSKENDKKEQEAIVNTELEAGAHGIILEPVGLDTYINNAEYIDVLKSISEKSENVVLIGAESYGYNFNTVRVNYEKAIEMLIKEIMSNKDNVDEVYFFVHGLDKHSSKNIYLKMKEGCEKENIEYELIDEVLKKYDFKSVIDNIYRQEKRVIFISLDKDSSVYVANILEENPEYRMGLKGFYGVGSNAHLLNELDKGYIDGLVTWNEYDIGYVAVKRAAEYILYKRDKSDFVTSAQYITRKDLQENSYARMLYPID